ncbi:uncharacterized protein LOC115751115 [Rhodamnia argentea]|uniref:Uncharacterized protein LOC115751115 n=1 Tax=Rhodamnia argentea TaxID=178133 RepID=A0A8B8QC26_9MYRT|nr:uncharacterized protein LOC115751115 [Rhodamnia argentea]
MASNEPESCEQLAACPSFNSYSANRLADVANRVALEDEDEGRGSSESEPTSSGNDLRGGCHEAGDDDFEFVSLVREHHEVLINGGQIGPVFPVFNRDLLHVRGDRASDREAKADRDHDREGAVSSIRIPLKDLFVEDRDPPSSSSSEADELEGIPEGSYCVWTPKLPAGSPLSPSRCKKSSSTGSCSKRWRLRDLLRRSNSEGKESFVFLTPSSRSSSMSRSSDAKAGGEAKEKASPPSDQAVVVAGRRNKAKEKETAAAASAHEVFYVRNRALKEGDKHRSYLPYRRGLVGFFANVNGLGRTFPPF